MTNDLMGNNRRDVVVIGAGISGLACAYRLKSLGLDSVLVERADRVGGVIQSELIDGFLIERGPNSAQGTEELLALIEELGIREEMAEGDPKAPAYVYFGGQLHLVPSGPASFIKSSLLSMRGKLRILGDLFVRPRSSEEEESVASFVERRIGREAAERLVAPFVSGIYAGDSEQLSVQAAFPRLANLEVSYGGLIRGALAKARESRRASKSAGAVIDKAAPTRRRLISFRRGMGFLPQALAECLGEDLITECQPIKLSAVPEGSPSSGSEPASERFRVDLARSSGALSFTCSCAVIATPARIAASLVRPLSDEIGQSLEEIYYPPLAIVYLAYDASAIKTPLEGFGFLVAPAEQLSILGCVWNSSLFEGRAPDGKALLTTFIGGARNPAVTQLGESELISIAHVELQRVLGVVGEPHVVSVTRYESAIPQYNLGHAERVRRIERHLKNLSGLHLIGNYLHGVSTGDCLKEADRVAARIAESLE